ncbi:SusC/RagA family TonB-linked outer membrane protein [Desertivirga brevis]|uniref:SusC/RagA family TonB-linked outer membrane protein n=1 Tax=Desertivirga brevis TaxID=2810310 RepID=UPI001A9775EB|nr:TonB-dependent receptor [Pedobacter sp. SYSU D00873]
MNKKLLEIIKRRGVQLVLLLLLLGSKSSLAQEQVTVEGVVRDTVSGLPGVAVKVVGSAKGATSDPVGRFKLVAERNATLSFSFVGFKSRLINLRERKVNNGVIELNVLLSSDNTTLEEVAITGFGGKQKKASLVSSITTVDVKEMKTASSNLTNALAGKVAGIISFQASGEPGLGTDNSSFFIRGLSSFGSGKVDPLILIDGIESSPTDMARLQTDDIADFSVLKDAAAASIYGARGANGVVLINTKLGKSGTPTFNFRVENKISTNTQNFQLADNINYMNLANEAVVTRDPLASEPYSQFKIINTVAGADPNLFPNNNWTDRLIKDYTSNQSYNLNINGGATRARYFIGGTFNRDNGILKVDAINNFNNNVRLNNYSIRSNVDFNVTKSTVVIVRMYGQFDDYNGPIGTPDPNQTWRMRSGGETTFSNALYANPVMFPALYPESMLPYIEHPLFGSSRTRNLNGTLNPSLYVNPYAEMVRGYQVYKTSNLAPQLEIKQDFSMITPGLNARAMGYLRRVSHFSVNRQYVPFYYQAVIDPTNQSYQLSALNDGGESSIGPTGREYLDYSPSGSSIDSRLWLEGSLTYDRTFKVKNAVSGMLTGYMSNYEGNSGGLIGSLPARNAGLSGRFTYGYDNRYMAEFNFGFNGSERFDKSHRFGFFPSAGLGYRISNEKFFAPLKSAINNLKLRATYGVVGNDAIGPAGDRFFYLSDVNLNNGGYGASFGRNDGAATYFRNGISINRYANSTITWEKSKQLNLGMDMTLFNSVDIVAEVFKQKRSQILQTIQSIDNASGLGVSPYANSGEAEVKGIDLSLAYRKNFSKSFWMNTRGTFTFSSSKQLKVDEIAYNNSLSHLSRIGYPINQGFGYIAERLFIDDAEVANSPVQQVDPNNRVAVRAGDIKYRDINNDGVINPDDMVAIGYPRQPQIIYGFGSSLGYKKLDVNFYFQGSARSSFLINPGAIQPFVTSGGYQSGLLQTIADDHWSETNRNIYAFWPRLSAEYNANNNQASTWWLRNGSFVRLKQVDMGYSFSNMKKIAVKSARLYFSATNLFVWSKFKMWDVEMGGNGLGYPVQSIYSLGLQVNL